MQAIAGAADDPQLPVRLILTVREEFLTRLMTCVLVRETLIRFAILRKPSSKTLVEILERSIKTVGYKFEDYLLASQLVSDVRKVQACFPLLQFACAILWQTRDKQRRVLTRAAYEEMGGVAGALVQHTEGVLKGLNTEEISIVKTMLLRLITKDKTRRIIVRDNLLEGLDARAEQLSEQLVESRLINIGRKEEGREGDCELAHEALITQWETLKRWIDESREELRLLRQLEQAAQLWDKRGRRVDELWGKQALKEVDEVLNLRMNCLNKRMSEVGALVRLFTKADTRVVLKAIQANTSLTDFAVCADEKSLRALYPPPRTAGAQARLEAIRRQLAEVETLSRSRGLVHCKSPPANRNANKGLPGTNFLIQILSKDRTRIDDNYVVAEDSPNHENPNRNHDRSGISVFDKSASATTPTITGNRHSPVGHKP